MAAIMSDDKDVLAYFDIDGIKVVLKESEDLTHPSFPGSKTHIEKLLLKNIDVMACPGCLKAADKSENDLFEGIKIANKVRSFNF